MTVMEVQAPTRSLAQRMAALERANEIRMFRARMKREIGAGRRSVHVVLAAPVAEVETMKVFDLLMAMPKVGRVKANRLLTRAHVSPSKTLGGLTTRQRTELLSMLPRSR
jgi:hypothetical protein